MKKFCYFLAILAGLFFLFFAWANYMGAQEVGRSSSSYLLLAIASFASMVGGIGGLASKNWAKNVSLGALIGIALIYITLGKLIMPVMVGVIALMIFHFEKKSKK